MPSPIYRHPEEARSAVSKGRRIVMRPACGGTRSMSEIETIWQAAEPDDPAGRPQITLLPGFHRRAEGGHPWVYSNEVVMDAAAKSLAPGTLVTLRRADERPFGAAMFNPHTLIAGRLLDRDASRAIDRFDAVLVMQANTAGMDRLTPVIMEALRGLLAPEAIVLRNDSPVRTHEGLPLETAVVLGAVAGPVPVEENGTVFPADVLAGQKTGWFFDQRDNRAFIAGLGPDARVLDLYCYSGGFAVAAAHRGAATVLGIDSSEPALALAAEAARRNGVAERATFRRGDVFAEAAALAAAGERFDIVVADPPPFARSKRAVPAALRGYRKLAHLAAQLTAPAGFLFLASCSYNVGIAEFAEAVRRGLADAGRAGRILKSTGASPDHPVHPALPESAYLKALTLTLD